MEATLDNETPRTRHKRVQSPSIKGQTLLDSSYKVRKLAFFQIGRVLQVLWAEPAGGNSSITDSPAFVQGRFKDEIVFTKVRGFVIVGKGHRSSIASPIVTYGAQGAHKPDIWLPDHAFVHSSKESKLNEESSSAGETSIRVPAIRVVPDNSQTSVDPMSLINFGKLYTIEHNVKVKAVGMVHPNSIEALEHHSSAVIANLRTSSSRNDEVETIDGQSVQGAQQLEELIAGHCLEKAELQRET